MDLSKIFDRQPKTAATALGHVDEASFATDVLGSDQLVLVDFWAPWCAPCRVMGGLLEEVAPLYTGRVRILKLNVDDSPGIAQRFGITGIPTMILFHKGKVVDQIVGAMPLNPLRAWLDRHAGAAGASGSTQTPGSSRAPGSAIA
jgi:thioredoxin 1